jgi:sugar lactone lactonase YvrE
LHFKTGLLYTASEGYFIPGNGEVFEIDPTSGKVTSIMSGLMSADGAWIDQERSLLYVSEVVLGRVIIYDLVQRKQIKKYKAPLSALNFYSPPNRLQVVQLMSIISLEMLDDFCLSQDGNTMFGADFWNGTVVAFAANGTSTTGTILASGVRYFVMKFQSTQRYLMHILRISS